MSCAREMLGTYSGTINVDADVLAAAIDAVSDCAQACAADTDADLNEHNLAEMVKCIRLCLNCADVCTATAGVINGRTPGQPSYWKSVTKLFVPEKSALQWPW